MPAIVKAAAAKATHQLVVEALANLKASIEQFQGSENPQVITTRKQMERQVEAFEAVRESLEGSPMNLRLFTGKH